MFPVRTRLSFSLCVLCVLCGSVSSAPPAVTYLFPAGGQVGTTVDLTAGGTFDPWPVKTWASDPALSVTPGKAKGSLKVAIAKTAKPGVHFLRLFNDQGASALKPFIVGTLPEVAEVEPNDHPGKPQMLASSTAVVNGRLDKTADVDIFAVKLTRGQTLVASLEANRTLKSPMDALLQALSPDGQIEMENHDHSGLDPQAVFTAPKDGTYRVRIFAFPAVPNSSIALSAAETYVYRLTLTTSGFADYALPLAVSASKPGSVSVQGWNIPPEASTLAVTATSEDDSGTVSHPALANAIPVKLETIPTYDAVSDPGVRKSPLEPPFVVTGRIDKPGDVFAIRFPAKKAQAITFQVESASLGLPLVPLIRVMDESGAVVNRVEPTKPGDESKLAFRTTTDGLYTIEVRDIFNDGSSRHAFLLRAMPVLPGFTLTCPNDRLYVVPGKPLDVKLAVARIAMKSDLEVRAIDLPAGLKMEVVPAAKPDPLSITLRFSAEKPTPGGNFKLVANPKDDPKMLRYARATDPELGETTTNLWVTATDSPKPPPVPKKKK